MQENAETKDAKTSETKNRLTAKDYEDILALIGSVSVQFSAAKRCVEIQDKVIAEIERLKTKEVQ